ncbi:docking protein 6 isoform X1 [Lates japonicus]|uniref:Docking protein 6 isoform X1 n=1 Tax=Lates japonicus TaxID=270547 RepID=A0AAD3MJ06_LATJO|nr:docking protein 6 isoform X1 [Lates japonicus]
MDPNLGHKDWAKTAGDTPSRPPRHISPHPPRCFGDGVVQEARLSSTLLSGSSESADGMVSPSSLPGWIAPPEPGSLSADTGAGCPPLALLPLDVGPTEPQVKDFTGQK